VQDFFKGSIERSIIFAACARVRLRPPKILSVTIVALSFENLIPGYIILDLGLYCIVCCHEEKSFILLQVARHCVVSNAIFVVV
jgi:hypothetical protein